MTRRLQLCYPSRHTQPIIQLQFSSRRKLDNRTEWALSGTPELVATRLKEKNREGVDDLLRPYSAPDLNHLIAVFGRHNLLDEAMAVLEWMKTSDEQPNVYHYTSLIVACRRCLQPARALDVFSDMTTNGVYGGNHTYSAMIRTAEDLADPKLAYELYTTMPKHVSPDNGVRNALISALGKAGQWEKAKAVFDEMRQGVPDLTSFNSLLKAAHTAKVPLEQLVEIRKDLRKSNIKPDLVTYTTLIMALANLGEIDEVWSCFLALQKAGLKADGQTLTVLVRALCDAGMLEEALVTFAKQKHLKIDRICYNALISGLMKHKRVDEADMVYHAMETAGVDIQLDTLNALIGRDPRRGTNIVKLSQAKGLRLDRSTHHLLIASLCSSQKLVRACRYVQRVESQVIMGESVTTPGGGTKTAPGCGLALETYSLLLSYLWEQENEHAVPFLQHRVVSGVIKPHMTSTSEWLTLHTEAFNGSAGSVLVAWWLEHIVREALRDAHDPPDLFINYGDETTRKRPVLDARPLRVSLPRLISALSPHTHLDVEVLPDGIKLKGEQVRAWMFGKSTAGSKLT